MDDDTFVNPFFLSKFISKLDPSKSLYIGNTIGTDFTGGGGGYILSRHILEKLARSNASKVHQCFKNQQGGKWCHYHSDWAIGQCIFDATGIRPINSNSFEQFSILYSDGPKYPPPSKFHRPNIGDDICPQNLMTCHPFNAKMQQHSLDILGRYYNTLIDPFMY